MYDEVGHKRLRSSLLLPQKRRVFFSFHYQQDIWRASNVRNSWVYQSDKTRSGFGFYDASIWENAKSNSDDALKLLIRQSLKNTSATCVLIGTQTAHRRWVRYEIVRSIITGNRLIGIYIHGVKNQYQQTAFKGPNPFDYIGTYLKNGTYYFVEFDGIK